MAGSQPQASDLEKSRDDETPYTRSRSTSDHGPDLQHQRTHQDHESHPPASLVQSHVEPPKSLPHEIAFVAIICMAQLMTQAGLAVSISPVFIIGESFGTRAPGYSLTIGTFILIAGRLGDIYGHKKFFVAGFLWFGFWSIIGGFGVYSNAIFFDCCRALQGIGPAFLLPNSVAILGRTYAQGRKKDMAFSLFGCTAPGGFMVGAVFSSLFAQLSWWPWTYWTMGIVCVLCAGIGSLVIPHTPRPEIHDSDSMWSHIDAAGSITGVVGLVLFNFAWNQAGVVGWNTPYTFSLLIIGVLFLVAFSFVESRAKYPLIPSSALNIDTGFVLACVGLGWASFGIWTYYLWQFALVLRGNSPLLFSAQMSPVAISGLCAALTTGYILSHVHASVVMLVSLCAFFTGTMLLATLPVDQTYWAQTFVATLIMPWGM